MWLGWDWPAPAILPMETCLSAPGLKITNFHYAHMKLPDGPSSFVEFPKWVHMPGYPSQLIQTAEEEAVLRARPEIKSEDVKKLPDAPVSAPAVAAAPVTTVLTGANDEREILLQIAKEKNIKVDARWKTDRIRATIERETKDQ